MKTTDLVNSKSGLGKFQFITHVAEDASQPPQPTHIGSARSRGSRVLCGPEPDGGDWARHMGGWARVSPHKRSLEAGDRCLGRQSLHRRRGAAAATAGQRTSV